MIDKMCSMSPLLQSWRLRFSDFSAPLACPDTDQIMKLIGVHVSPFAFSLSFVLVKQGTLLFSVFYYLLLPSNSYKVDLLHKRLP